MLKRNLLTSLLLYESVRTTRNRAKAVQPLVDRLIATAKASAPHVAIRRINRVVTDPNASKKIMEVLVKRYAARSSGLTKVVPAGARLGDGAMLVDLSLVDAQVQPVAEKVPTQRKETVKESDNATPKAKKPKKPRASSSTTPQQ